MRIISLVRSILILICFAVAAGLHASVPAAAPAAKFNPASVSTHFGDLNSLRARQQFGLTASPVDGQSFYVEFYDPQTSPGRVQRKGGIIHWFTTAIKKTAHKVNLIPD